MSPSKVLFNEPILFAELVTVHSTMSNFTNGTLHIYHPRNIHFIDFLCNNSVENHTYRARLYHSMLSHLHSPHNH